MKIASTVVLLTASASAIHVRSASTAQVSVWGQCGGKNHNGDTTCASGSYCKVINEWYSQCQPGGNGQVGVWAQCGGNDYKGATQCTPGNTCKTWNADYSQCVPSNNDDKKDDTGAALPAGWLELAGLKWTLLDNDLATTGDKSFADCVQSGTKPAKDGTTRFFAVWDSTKKVCNVASTVYTYEMAPGFTSAVKYNADKYVCVANADYANDEVNTFQTRFNRCLDSCDNLGDGCNGVTYVREASSGYGKCSIKLRKDTSASPKTTSNGSIACKRK
ncbi:hypothetical protein SDRG_11836 [Saprolegnia diclina VS20]|uniref:CBM1 domain-containing protein n=1 Tax=Saprolegnia diclina (strain VS20) TaxID=1156394 RepID=T0PYA9_SAPDV|nr:hypothetical protein SDRG_11836 [Saprolegnia diclina VS20]EQC30519.1 hypothetical protein SDRG_11836 [Saprolegnia diclina VS20]|eukprot:XP_008616112.1 hypothetical protein SDRG_11836 [Saprolegnia diclina VS20]